MVALVQKGSAQQCVFEHHRTLASGQEGRLTLSSHPGLAVVPRYDYPRSAAEWRYVEIGIGPAHMAMHVRFESNFIVRVHDERVMDIAHWKYEEGNTLNVLRSASNHPGHTRYSGGGRSFVFNHDGSISPQHAPHLVLGVSTPDCTLVSMTSPNKVTIANAHELRSGGSVPLHLSSHPGYAIVPKFAPRRINEWGVAYAHWGIAPAKEARLGDGSAPLPASVRLEGSYLMSTHSASHDFILDVPFAKLHVGCDNLPLAVISFDDRSKNREPNNKARLFQVNADGSISPSRAPHLALGLREGSRLLPQMEMPVEQPVEAPSIFGSMFAGAQPVAQAFAQPMAVAQPVMVAAVAINTEEEVLPMGKTLQGSAPQSLDQITGLLRAELNLSASANMKEVVDQACEQLGVDMKGALMERARACQQMLGK